jgi:hypothetical protein
MIGRLLIDHNFIKVVVEQEAAMKAEEHEKVARKQKKAQFDIELSEWTTSEQK